MLKFSYRAILISLFLAVGLWVASQALGLLEIPQITEEIAAKLLLISIFFLFCTVQIFFYQILQKAVGGVSVKLVLILFFVASAMALLLD